ncbi:MULTISPECIES: CoA-acylating methylmalonate-semialdehyde dehydrogenase [Corynebacterium]|uniref:CoA-acylating methylmalonate-semialdehyde dehydrogenase n=1 Tax=Corynebacterium TaxID=1716 RepID=UPI00124E4794|nr:MULTISPECIES: CoA-acylating methylmalonate-semialdehyde dehydrogenase [Corynebacterium]
MKTINHYVGGREWAGSSTATQDVMNPSTGTVQAQVRLASTADVQEAIANARTAQPEWAALNPQKRMRVLMEWIRLINEHMDELATALSLEHGKTFADAQGDVQRGLEVVEVSLGAPHFLKGEFSDSVGTGVDTYSMRQPLGVVAGITPFNFPAMIPLWKAGPALAAGNAFILKPSERDPSVPLKLAELFTAAGGPDGVFNVVHGDKEAVDALLDSEVIQAVGFVGSTPIAQYIYTRCAETGKRAQCFGGAKNHMLILPDANLDEVADALVGAAYGSAGERCMAISVAVPVGEETATALREKLVERIEGLKVGHCLDPDADYGPLVATSAVERVRSYIDAGEKAGAELVVDGRERGATDSSFQGEDLSGGYYLAPTLFDHVTPEMSIYTDEIFGPVLTIVHADSIDEALRLPTEHAYGNGVSIFTRNGGAARDIAQRIQVGMVGINVPIPVPIAYHTFGGWKASGFGDLNQHGPDAFRFYTKTKTVTSRWTRDDAVITPHSGSHFVMPVVD